MMSWWRRLMRWDFRCGDPSAEEMEWDRAVVAALNDVCAVEVGERHKHLHNRLDELLACFITAHPDKRPSNTTCLDLLKWSHAVTQDPSLCSQHKP